MRAFLEAGGFKGFTDTFEDLHGLKQLPGLASQRLMADGYGFGAEGDWKTVGAGAGDEGDGRRPAGRHVVHGGLHLSPAAGRRGQVLGAHMLEVCPSIASGKPTLEIHPLGIGGKEDPVRLVFDARAGPGAQRQPDRPRQPLPPDRQRGRRRRASQAAEAAGGARGVGVPARPQDRLRARGSWPAARITRASATPSRRKCWKTSPPSPASSWR